MQPVVVMMIEGTKFRDLFEERPIPYGRSSCITDGCLALPTLQNITTSYYYYMKHEILLRLEIRLDCEKTKQTKVAPYIRFRNGKKELVKGYVRKNREL